MTPLSALEDLTLCSRAVSKEVTFGFTSKIVAEWAPLCYAETHNIYVFSSGCAISQGFTQKVAVTPFHPHYFAVAVELSRSQNTSIFKIYGNSST
jgi:hypothetical protein